MIIIFSKLVKQTLFIGAIISITIMVTESLLNLVKSRGSDDAQYPVGHLVNEVIPTLYISC